jgi:two-component system osmolarity sensor histidine kinase EnvZ
MKEAELLLQLDVVTVPAGPREVDRRDIDFPVTLGRRVVGEAQGELPQSRWFVRQFVTDLKSRLPGQASVVRWVADNQGTVWVRMPVGGEQFWFTERGVNLQAAVPTAVIAVFVFFSLLAIAGAALIQRRINLPLAQLVEATAHLAERNRREPLDEGGPTELAAVSRAFNRMAETLANAEAERAVVLAGVSHDLRTPIAKMRLAIEMLASRGEPELIESMRRSAAELTAVTEQFLVYARPETALELEPSDLSAIVLDTVDSYKTDSRSIHVEVEVGPPVCLHRQLLRRAIDNLLTNALRYSEGDVEVETRFRNGRAIVSVLDRGPGIPDNEVAAVRRPFARGTRGAHVPGAGLGLAIVDRIVHAHGARLELLARAGGGLEARIDLPVR